MLQPPFPDVTIELRSDTLTRPTAGMRRAMAEAEVGDDVYGEDPTVNALQARVAELLGHEAALFVPTGSMGNLLGIWSLVQRGEEVLCDEQAHIARAELGAHAALHGLTMRTWHSPDGVAEPDAIAALIAPPTGHLVHTAALALENTHNFGSGSVQPLGHLRATAELARAQGVRLHLDGARLWNAHVASGVALETYGRLFDTVNVCFSKGLGAPVGSMLVSSKELIDKAHDQRKRLGGGMRQAGVLAAAAMYALDRQLERLADDHASASAFAEALAAEVPAAVKPPQTNIVVIDTGALAASDVAAQAAKLAVRVSVLGPRTLRAVTSLEVTTAQATSAGRLLGQILGG